MQTLARWSGGVRIEERAEVVAQLVHGEHDVFLLPANSTSPSFGFVHRTPSFDSATHVTSDSPSRADAILPR